MLLEIAVLVACVFVLVALATIASDH